ncbi:interleukin 21 receptor, tandem duplicate 2 isoform X2 [Chanodichthys erythropterus]|uniref:interleukin 21 receptor, tandem duplicate 2 isoform X2 n=1 Tax=Chanodichthys erythropterus TaxID=933992 RepID=UPI00351F5171
MLQNEFGSFKLLNYALKSGSVYIQSCTRMMIRTGMICIFLAFSVELNASSQALKEGLICETDYCKTVSCSLKLPVTSTRNISHWLEFQWNNHICPLQRASEDHTCTFTVNGTMADFDKVAVILHYLENGNKNSSQLNDCWVPAENIKPKAPFNLTLQYTNGTYNFSWTNGYEDERYGRDLPIEYNFLYYKDGDNDSEVIVHPENKWIQIDEMNLDPVTTYTAMVRSGIREEKEYRGTWSEWSSAVKWKTTYREDDSNQVGKIVIGTFLTVGLLILLIFVPAARFKMKDISWVPTPATYFQPLYQNYQGNFQCWVLAKSPLQNVHIMEDFSTIDKISEVMMTTLQDEVEKTGMYPAAQYHQPYVGPTAEVWAPRQMPDTCSETSIPCEEFSLFCEELPVKVDDIMQSLTVACLSGDVLSLKDSALSLESLEDCEESEAPVIINPVPVCFKQDYCTLTNTPTGPVPTFTRDIELDENTF